MNEQEMKEVDLQTIISEWELSKQYVDNFTNDFPSLDNIVDGIPINHKEGNPYVGDTTLGGLVRSIPRDSLHQIPVFAANLNGSKVSTNAYIASFLLRRGVFNEDTFGKGLLSTLQIGAEQALTHGYAPFMPAAGIMFSEFGTTLRLLHYSDCALEPGVADANEAGYFYVRANLTKSRVRKILKKAENNPDTNWDPQALKELLEVEPAGQDYSIYQSDAKKKNDMGESSTYEFITRYEVDKQAPIITFCPQLTEKPLRGIKSRSKFGFPRIQFLVIDPAALNPFGTSRVRLASPNQNLMNAYYQNVAAMFILNSKPPVLKRGRFTKPVQLKQGVVWETLDQNAKAELVEMSNGTLSQFVPMARQMSAQIQNIMGTPRGNIGGDSSALGYSKTAPGVKAQREDLDVSTNQITKILENFLRQYALVALDIYISEQSGDDTLILDDEAKNAINSLAKQNFTPTPEMPEFVPPVGSDNTLEINWEEYYNSIKTLSVEIELSMSKDDIDEKKRGDLQDLITSLAQTADPNDMEAQAKIKELRDMLIDKTVPDVKKTSSTPSAPVVTPPSAPPAPAPPSTGPTTPVQ